MSAFTNETRFDETGTLRKPGPIGRLVRSLLGVWLLYVCWVFWNYPGVLIREALPPWENLLPIVFSLWLIPPVVNIGFGTNWKGWPRYLAMGIIILWMISLALTEGTWWSPTLGHFAWLFVLYTFGHLGLSFVLAAAIATPGCEMRALPHLWTLLAGRETKEHFCPGFLHGLDAWETKRATRSG